MNTVCRCFILLITLSCATLICAKTAQAQQRSTADPWWFEIEAIVFERDVDAKDLHEAFPLKITPVDTTDLLSFITETLYPDFSMLRMGAKQCLAQEKPVAFPKQTVKLPEFAPELIIAKQRTSSQSDAFKETSLTKPGSEFYVNNSFAKDFFANKQIRSDFLNDYNLSDAEYVLANSPSLQWLAQIENLFRDVNQSLADWRENNPSVWKIGLYPMQEFAMPDAKKRSRPSIRVPDTLYCNWAEEESFFESEFARELKNSVFLHSVPKVINGIEYPFSDEAYVLPKDKLAMTKLKRDIQRRRGLNVILHTAWRQNVVVGRDKAPWYRFYAGDNLSRQYEYKGLPVEPEQTTEKELIHNSQNMFDQIQAILQQPGNATIEQDVLPPIAYRDIAELDMGEGYEDVWTLDGRLKIFIEYIGGTPYLHIDSDLNYRKPVYIDWMSMVASPPPTEAMEPSNSHTNSIPVVPKDNFLQAYHFDQIRRVISNEIHYFDHPLFGMVFQIRRHRRPDPELPPDYYD